MTLQINPTQTLSFIQNLTSDPSDIYTFIIWYRRVVMTISSSLLVINIIMILKYKQYIYNTLKLFMWMQILTVVGQLIVLPHYSGFQNGWQSYDDQTYSVDKIIQEMISQDKAKMIPCTLQAYLNLFCYNISYMFAVLISLYVRRVIDNTHKYFMRRHKMLIIYSVILTLLVYTPPLVMAFCQNVPYSFGPVGFKVMDEVFSGDAKTYMFYCGITARYDSWWASFLSTTNMALIPILMFCIHSVLLYKNYQSIKFLKGLQELNPRQWFILKSGTLSTMVFVFQFINLGKYFLSIIDKDSQFLIVLVGLLNMIFDLLPILLAWTYYKKYYRRGKKLQESSLIRTLHDQSLQTQEILNY